jgi:hypothetical protein
MSRIGEVTATPYGGFVAAEMRADCLGNALFLLSAVTIAANVGCKLWRMTPGEKPLG